MILIIEAIVLAMSAIGLTITTYSAITAVQVAELSTFERYLDRYGLPLAFLAVIITAIYLVARRVGPLLTTFGTGLQTQATAAFAQVLEVYRERLDAAEIRAAAADERSRSSQEKYLLSLREQGDRHETAVKAQAEAVKTAMELAAAKHAQGIAEAQGPIREIVGVVQGQTQAITDLAREIQRNVKP